jgi:hypothetical protein
MKRFLSILGLFILAFGLPACRLECFGDGPITWDSVTLTPNALQTVAGGNPIGIVVHGRVHCGGFSPQFTWSLEPALGQIKASSDPLSFTYQPPNAIDATTDIKIIVHFDGYGQNTKSDVTIRVLKP